MLLVNLIGEFRVSIFQQFLPVLEPRSMPDRLVEVFVSSAVEMKAFAIFALRATGAFAAWGYAGGALSNLAPVVLASGYAALVFALVEHPVAGVPLRVFAPLGRMAFSNYILQSLIFGFIFFGYGLGYFGHMGAAHALLVGIAVYTM